MVAASALHAIRYTAAALGGASVHNRLRKLRPKKTMKQRRTGLRNAELGMEGVLPMVASIAAARNVRLSETETIDACCGSCENQRMARILREERKKPNSPGRSRKPRRVGLSAGIMGTEFRLGVQGVRIKTVPGDSILVCLKLIAAGIAADPECVSNAFFLQLTDNYRTDGCGGPISTFVCMELMKAR